MISFESLEWGMGFQWPVIAVFAALLAIGIGRLMTWGSEQDLLTDISSAGAQKKRPASANSAGKLAKPKVRLIRGVNVRPKPAGTMRHHAKRRQPMSAARSKRG